MLIETAKKIAYKAFGLKIVSEIHLPELMRERQPIELIDVFIKVDDLTHFSSELIANQGKFFVKENMVLFQIKNTATFCILDGKSIIVSPIKGADMDKIRLYILGTCMGVILMQRKVLPLHGSAVAINGKAYAFIGNSGAGKSTLASAFLEKGFHLLSDDVIAVSLSLDKIPYVFPSYPQQKLWQESLSELRMETSDYRPLFERETKFAIPVESKFYNRPLPLAGVFELVKTKDDNLNLVPVEKLERFRTLFCQTFRSSLIQRLGLMEWHFHYSSQIVNKIPLYQIRRPQIGFTAHEIVSAVLNVLNEEENR